MIPLFTSEAGEDFKPAQVARVYNLHLAYYSRSLCVGMCVFGGGVVSMRRGKEQRALECLDFSPNSYT